MCQFKYMVFTHLFIMSKFNVYFKFDIFMKMKLMQLLLFCVQKAKEHIGLYKVKTGDLKSL